MQAEELIASFSTPENRAEGYLILFTHSKNPEYLKKFKAEIMECGIEIILAKPHWVKVLAEWNDELLEDLMMYLQGGWKSKIDRGRQEERFEELRRLVYNLVDFLRSRVDLPRYVDFVLQLVALPFFSEEAKLQYIDKILDKLQKLS